MKLNVLVFLLLEQLFERRHSILIVRLETDDCVFCAGKLFYRTDAADDICRIILHDLLVNAE